MLDLYSYSLPTSAIASRPASPRDSSKLFVYHTQTGEWQTDVFRNLPSHLPDKSFLTLNETKVLPVRLMAQVEGKEVELLIFLGESLPSKNQIKATCSRFLKPGSTIQMNKDASAIVLESHEKIFLIQLNFPYAQLEKILLKAGHTPIPPYIQNAPSEDFLRTHYQTVFAKHSGSAAAPTASLHFTHRLFKKLKEGGVPICKCTLSVGLGTFAPLLPEHLASKKLYEEHYEISSANWTKIQKLKKEGYAAVAVGSTVTRTLETLACTHQLRGATDLLITPPFDFQMVDHLITNFHVPQSSLMHMVEAFLQHKKAPHHLKELYQIALKENFRFYSFGDAMLLL